jgi:hypothetical protein
MTTQLTVEAYRALMKADPPGMAADSDPGRPPPSYHDAVDNAARAR